MRRLVNPNDSAVGAHVMLDGGEIGGLIYVVGDVDLPRSRVKLRWAFSEDEREDVLRWLTPDEVRFCKETLLAEAREWARVMDHARRSGYRSPWVLRAVSVEVEVNNG